MISNDATVNKDVSKASSAFGRLSKRVRKNHSLRLSTKIQVYKAIVITTLLYGAEAWVLYRKQLRRLDQSHQRYLRAIKWQNHVSNEDVLSTANVPSIESTLLQLRLSWAGHVARMEDTHMPKAVLFGELSTGKLDQGAPKKLTRSAEEGTCHGSCPTSFLAASCFKQRQLVNKQSRMQPTPTPVLLALVLQATLEQAVLLALVLQATLELAKRHPSPDHHIRGTAIIIIIFQKN